MASISDIQTALLARGFDPGPADGERGPRTIAAIRAFQAAHGLDADGVAGPLTLASLGLSADPFPPWMMALWRLRGEKEIHGRINNDAIMSLAPKIAKKFPALTWPVSIFSSDEVPWCGAAVAYSLAEAGIMPDPLYPSALAWSDWGQKLNGPAQGAIAVKTRHGGGHVFFVAGKTADGRNIAGLGGNQGDMVKISPFNPFDITAYRWPPGVPLPPVTEFVKLPVVGASGPVGQSER